MGAVRRFACLSTPRGNPPAGFRWTGFWHGIECARWCGHRTNGISRAGGKRLRQWVIDRALPNGGATLPQITRCKSARLARKRCRRGARGDQGGISRLSKSSASAWTSTVARCCRRWQTARRSAISNASDPSARPWPKLWKHHGAKTQTPRMNQIAASAPRLAPALRRHDRLNGFSPRSWKDRDAPHVYDAAQVWLEAGDWLVWQLTSGPYPRCGSRSDRSTCRRIQSAVESQAGYPSRDYFCRVIRRWGHRLHEDAGRDDGARREGRRADFGSGAASRLRPGIPVWPGDRCARRVPGAGVPSFDEWCWSWDSSCQMMNSRIEQLVRGHRRVVEYGILPVYFGYETGQPASGRLRMGRSNHRTLAR